MTEPHNVDELADQALSDGDSELLTQLAALYSKLDPVPPGAVERISFALSLAEMEAELAEIQLHGAEPAGARTDVETIRTISFAASTVTIVVTIGDRSLGALRVDGWLSPAQEMRVILRSPGGDQDSFADVNGRFVFADVPAGLASIVVYPPSLDRPVVTPTFQL